ncbi:MAG: hypothetical protein NVSMB23_16860 [Myxococcales bacterium]
MPARAGGGGRVQGGGVRTADSARAAERGAAPALGDRGERAIGVGGAGRAPCLRAGGGTPSSAPVRRTARVRGSGCARGGYIRAVPAARGARRAAEDRCGERGREQGARAVPGRARHSGFVS